MPTDRAPRGGRVEPTLAELVAYVEHLREVLEMVNRETPCPVRSFTLDEFILNRRKVPNA